LRQIQKEDATRQTPVSGTGRAVQTFPRLFSAPESIWTVPGGNTDQ